MVGVNTKNGIVSTTIIALTIFLIVGVCPAQGKRGCSAFGHSCFGGHGKRMDTNMGSAPEEVMFGGNQQGGLQDIVFTPPRNIANQETQDDLSPIRRPYSSEIYNLSPFLRQWLKAYQSSQELSQNNI